MEKTEAIFSTLALGGRFETQTAVFLGGAGGAAGFELAVADEDDDATAAGWAPFPFPLVLALVALVEVESTVVCVTSTASPAFLFFCLSIRCCLASTALAGV